MAKQRKPRDKASETAFERPRVVVRFREGVRLADRPDLGDQIEHAGIGPWKKLIEQFPGLKLSPVFTYLKRGEFSKLTSRAMEMDPTYKPADFNAFYYVDAPPVREIHSNRRPPWRRALAISYSC